MDKERCYVIRCHDLWDGSTVYRGNKGVFAKEKTGLIVGDTYTLSGAKRALSNIRRLCFDPDRYQYSIERLEEFYIDAGGHSAKEKKSQEICCSIEKAMTRLDELCDENNFHNGDKMRINEVRVVLRFLKEKLESGNS